MEEIPEKWTTAHVVPRVKWSSSVSQLASINASEAKLIKTLINKDN